MTKNLYRVKHASWSNYHYAAASDQYDAATLCCRETNTPSTECSVEYVGEVEFKD